MHSFSLIFLKFLNLWSVCVPFICCLCIQCIYIYICIYIYFPKFWDVLFQKKFRSNESNACLLGGTCFFLWKFSQTLWSLTFLSETFRPKKRHTKNSTRRPKKLLPSWDSCPLCWPSLRAMASLSWRKSLRFIRPPLHWSWELWCALDLLGFPSDGPLIELMVAGHGFWGTSSVVRLVFG